MQPLSRRITFEIILGTVLAGSLAMVLHQAARIAELQRQKAADAQSLALLREALRQKDLQKSPAPETEPIGGNDHSGIAKREAVITRLDRELAESHATIANLQSQLAGANDQNAKALSEAQANLQKQQADLQEQIADLQKKLDAAISQSDIARQRAAALEAENARLQAASTNSSTRAADVAHMISSLQDIERRRDVYLTSILRRYRDITGEFRAMSSMLDTSHDSTSTACSGATLGRIQNAVNLTEDDLNQLNELNARAQKIEKQLLKK